MLADKGLRPNPVYLGKVKYKKEVHPGEHQAIIPPDVWQQVHARAAKSL